MTFEQELTSNMPELKRYAATIARKFKFPDHEAEDLFQETCLRAMMYRKGYDDQNKMYFWLKHILYGAACNMYRSKKNRQEATCDLPSCVLPDQENVVLLADIKCLLEKFGRHGKTLIHVAVDERETKEVAAAENISEGTVRSRMNFARNWLTEIAPEPLDNEWAGATDYFMLEAAE